MDASFLGGSAERDFCSDVVEGAFVRGVADWVGVGTGDEGRGGRASSLAMD